MDISKLEIPILQAPVEATVELAVAVSDSGGMGSIQGTWSRAYITEYLNKAPKN